MNDVKYISRMYPHHAFPVVISAPKAHVWSNIIGDSEQKPRWYLRQELQCPDADLIVDWLSNP
jgi:hypothetical protein